MTDAEKYGWSPVTPENVHAWVLAHQKAPTAAQILNDAAHLSDAAQKTPVAYEVSTMSWSPGPIPVSQLPPQDWTDAQHIVLVYAWGFLITGLMVFMGALFKAVDGPSRRFGYGGAVGGILVGAAIAPVLAMISGALWPFFWLYVFFRLFTPRAPVYR